LKTAYVVLVVQEGHLHILHRPLASYNLGTGIPGALGHIHSHYSAATRRSLASVVDRDFGVVDHVVLAPRHLQYQCQRLW
jgi:hypothetical protein